MPPTKKVRRVKKKRPPPAPARPRAGRPSLLTGLLVLALAGAVVGAVLSLRQAPAARVSERTVTVGKGVVQSVVSGSGNLQPASQLDVDFGTSGTITKLYVKEGQHVSKGELLAKLDSQSQRVALAQAQASLVDAEDALTTSQDAEDTATTAASTATTATVAAVTQATPPATGGAATPTPTATATPRAAPTATAQPSATAQGGGGSTQSVESANAAVESAQLALDEAQDALDATLLRAPAAGTIASISSAVGDSAGSSSSSGDNQAAAASSSSSSVTAFIVLAQLSRLKLELALSESDIGKVKVGQPATVTINAASGEEVAGHVTKIGVLSSSSSTSTSTSTSSAVSYPVVVTLDQTTQGIRPGMSATADIVTSQASGVTVPNQALRGSTVTVESNGQRETRRVSTGVVGDSQTQVVSGLAAGDKVIVTSTSATLGAASSSAQTGAQAQRGFGGGGFGGGGFAGGGGATFRAGGGGGPRVGP